MFSAGSDSGVNSANARVLLSPETFHAREKYGFLSGFCLFWGFLRVYFLGWKDPVQLNMAR